MVSSGRYRIIVLTESQQVWLLDKIKQVSISACGEELMTGDGSWMMQGKTVFWKVDHAPLDSLTTTCIWPAQLTLFGYENKKV